MGSGSAYNYIAMKDAIEDSGLEQKDISNEKKLFATLKKKYPFLSSGKIIDNRQHLAQKDK